MHVGGGGVWILRASPVIAAADQLAAEDHTPGEQGRIAADLERLNRYCLETPDELVTELSDGEQDLQRHGIKADGASVAAGLLATARAQPKGATPTNCGQLVASYLNAHGG
jgi:hypothetical protein